MLSNHLYNLVEQLSVESRSIWRMDTYIRDAEDCDECGDFWRNLKAEKEKRVTDLRRIMCEHLEQRKKEEEITKSHDLLEGHRPAYLAG